MYFYSASKNAFYPEILKGRYEENAGWPDDAVAVSEEIFNRFLNTPPEGKCRVAGDDGLPSWGNIPLPTVEENIAAVTAKKQELISEASLIIAPLKDAFDGGYIDDADKLKLIAWQKYRYALTKVDPAKPVWPEKPAE